MVDQAFLLHGKMIRLYARDNLSDEQTIFNNKLSKAHRTIENSFGILVRRWGILKARINSNVTVCEEVYVVLHNFQQSDEESLPESERRYCLDQEKPDGEFFPGAWRKCIDLQSLQRLVYNNSTRKAQSNRHMLCTFFNSPLGSKVGLFQMDMKGSVPIPMN